MTEKDKEINELRRENQQLRSELAAVKAMQRRLFKLVPADRIIALMHESPEEKRPCPRSNTCGKFRRFRST